MIKKLGAGLLSIFIATSSATEAAAGEGYEFQKKVPKGFSEIYVPVDCDRLGKNGQITREFVKQMGIKSHMDLVERKLGPNSSDATVIDAMKDHIANHSIDRREVERLVTESAEICRRDFSY